MKASVIVYGACIWCQRNRTQAGWLGCSQHDTKHGVMLTLFNWLPQKDTGMLEHMFITFFVVFLVHFLNSHNVFMLQKIFCNVLYFNILNEIPASNIAKHESCEQAFSDNNIHKKQIAAIEALRPSAFFFQELMGQAHQQRNYTTLKNQYSTWLLS